jgi:hypothetical protein
MLQLTTKDDSTALNRTASWSLSGGNILYSRCDAARLPAGILEHSMMSYSFSVAWLID